MVEGYKPQDFSFFHRGGKISTTLVKKRNRNNFKSILRSKNIYNYVLKFFLSIDEA